MRRSPVLLIICVLLLATGLVLTGVATSFSPPALPNSDRLGETNVALAHRFYDAVSTVLATGETGDLAALVAPDLVEHPDAIDGATGFAGLERSLLALRTVFPGLGLVVDDIRASGENEVTARIRTSGPIVGSFLGLPLPAAAAALGPIEMLRVASDRIAERWTRGETIRFEPLALRASAIADPERPPGLVVLTRVTMDPGANFMVNTEDEPRFLLVETGQLTADLADPGSGAVGTCDSTDNGSSCRQPAVDPSQSRPLAAGDVLTLDSGTTYVLANATQSPAVALAATILRPSGDRFLGAMTTKPTDVLAGSGRLLPKVTVKVLAPGLALTDTPGAALGIGRVVLAAGTELAFPAQPGSSLIAIQEGRLDVAAIGGDAHGYCAQGRPWLGPRAGLGPGDSAEFETGIGALWRAGDGPATFIVVVAVTPDEVTTGTSVDAGTAMSLPGC